MPGSQRRVALGAALLSLVLAAPLGGAAVSAAPAARATACRILPANSYWHADVSHLPVDPRSATWLRHMSPASDLHPDFGGPYGIPITRVTDSHPLVRVRFLYADESDRVGYPLGSDTRIEGGARSTGDRHAIVWNTQSCRLYETWSTRRVDGTWHAGSGATWSLTSNRLRPDGWTSADAAGLPILPGLLRWSEVQGNSIHHAIRFTTDVTSSHHLWPARHDAGSTSSWSYPPMGARFRLRSSYDAAGLGVLARRVVVAMKRYGLVLADNGSPWFFQGAQDAHWPSSLIADLKRIPARAFVAVDTAPLEQSADSGAVAP